jgi:predicted PurR-regulated permease PerM
VIRPIIISIFFGILLVFIFNPIYKFILKGLKSKNISAGVICVLVISIVVIPFWFLAPIVADQVFKIYLAAQKIDFVALFQNLLPSLFQSEEFAAQVSSILTNFISTTMNSILNDFSDIILDFPSVLMHFLVVLFTFFFVMRDQNEIIEYVKSLLPFPKEIEKRLFDSSKEITYSVLYGHVVIGFLQGLIVGIGFFIFGIPNALFLTLVACLVAMVPVLGAPFVWVPVVIYLFISGNVGPAWGIIGFGLFAGTIDNFLRPLIISKRSKVSTLLITIGMVGGLFFLGLAGFIVGPLILAYLLIILEIYRDKKLTSSVVETSVVGS